MKKWNGLAMYAGALSLTFLVPSANATPAYDLQILPFTTLSPITTSSVALNNEGAVAGGLANPDGSVSLAEWSNGVVENLGVPAGLPSALNIVQALSINDSGVIAGTVHSAAGGVPSDAFVYSGGVFNVLPLVSSSDLRLAKWSVTTRRPQITRRGGYGLMGLTRSSLCLQPMTSPPLVSIRAEPL